jgi:hypothetical protein
MLSDDVLVLVQLNPPGIELCRVSNMKKEAEGDGGGPRMDKLCTLLLPPLLQPRDGTSSTAHIISVDCVGDHPGHQGFSRGPWPEYHHAPLGAANHSASRQRIASSASR